MQGPMKTTRAFGSLSFMSRAVSTMGVKLSAMLPAKAGKCRRAVHDPGGAAGGAKEDRASRAGEASRAGGARGARRARRRGRPFREAPREQDGVAIGVERHFPHALEPYGEEAGGHRAGRGQPAELSRKRWREQGIGAPLLGTCELVEDLHQLGSCRRSPRRGRKRYKDRS